MGENFRIGFFYLRIVNVKDILIPVNFLLFEVSHTIREVIYHFCVANNLLLPSGTIRASRKNLTVYKTVGGEEQSVGIKGMNTPYGCYLEISNCEVDFISNRYFRERWGLL